MSTAKDRLERNRASMAKERGQRLAAYRQAKVDVADMEAAVAADPDDRLAQDELTRAEARLDSALASMRHWGDPNPEESTGAGGSCFPSASPPPAPTAACTPGRPGAGHPSLPPEELAAVLAAERERSTEILAEAKALGIGRKYIDAALASDMTPAQFVERFAPEEAAARRIIAA